MNFLYMKSTLGCSPILLEQNPHWTLEFLTYLLLSTCQCDFSHNHFSFISLLDTNAKHIHNLIFQINSISSAICIGETLMDSSSVSSNNPSCLGAMIVLSLISWSILTELLWSDPINLANPSASTWKKNLCRREACLSGVTTSTVGNVYFISRRVLTHCEFDAFYQAGT